MFGWKKQIGMKPILAAIGLNSIISDVSCWISDLAAQRAARKEVKAVQRAARNEANLWVKTLPEGFVADLVTKVPMPDHLWTMYQHILDGDTRREAPVIYQTYVDEHFPRETTERRVALAEKMMSIRYSQWADHLAVQQLCRERLAAVMAESEERAMAYRARLAARPPSPNSPEGMRAYALRSARAGAGYRHSSGRELTDCERLRLGLPPGERKPAPGSLLDGHGLR